MRDCLDGFFVGFGEGGGDFFKLVRVKGKNGLMCQLFAAISRIRQL